MDMDMITYLLRGLAQVSCGMKREWKRKVEVNDKSKKRRRKQKGRERQLWHKPSDIRAMNAEMLEGWSKAEAEECHSFPLAFALAILILFD
jgi:hypothetical protein